MTTTLRDCIFGLAIGDALGVPFEFRARGSFDCTDMIGHGTHDMPAGTFSDDTSLALATCDSIRRCGGIDVKDMRTCFAAWLDDGEYAADHVVFDVGGTTADAIMSGVGRDGEYDNGNGSLMRIAPLAFTDATDDDIRAVSAITHAHPMSTETCVDFVHILRDVVACGGSPEIEKRVGKPVDEVQSDGFVLHTFDAALWCAANTSTYRDCVIAAVNLGSDTDTTAAVAGALAGALYGLEAIPASWVETLRAKDIIERVLF